MSLIFLVDYGSCRFETVPDLLTEFLCNRTVFLPLLMQFLKFPERLDYIWILCKSLCFKTEFLLHLKIFLEIKIAELTIDLDHIVELLNIKLICFIDIPEILRRNRSDSPPSVLNFAEGRECSIDIFLFFEKCLEVFNNGLLHDKVFFPFLLELPVIFGTLLPIFIIKGFESPFYFCKRIVGNAFLCH